MDIVRNEQHKKEIQEAEDKEVRSAEIIGQLKDEIKQRHAECR